MVFMKSFSNRHISQIVLSILALFAVDGVTPIFIHGATIPAIALPQKTIAVFDVAILKPTGDPVTAPSSDNQFTYSGPTGIALVPVLADITPSKVEVNVAPLIKWTFESIPAGSALSWGVNSWPGESTAGKGKSATATFTGYPTNNREFKPLTLKMEVIRDGKVLLTKNTTIELFFERDRIATGRTVPNWFFYWLQAIGGRANTVYGGTGNYGKTPGMTDWSYTTAQDKTQVIIFDGSQLAFAGHPCSPHGLKPLTGIDLFENIVIHENKHTLQIAQADPIVGSAAGTPWRFGWSWNQGNSHNHWTLGTDGKPGITGVDDDNNGIVDDLIVTGPGELGYGDDVNLSDTSDSSFNWPKKFNTPPTPPTGISGCYPIEMDAEAAQPDVDGARKDVDWSYPGKQHF